MCVCVFTIMRYSDCLCGFQYLSLKVMSFLTDIITYVLHVECHRHAARKKKSETPWLCTEGVLLVMDITLAMLLSFKITNTDMHQLQRGNTWG